MALVTKFAHEVFALVLNGEQKVLLLNAPCSQFATHCLNAKLREMNEVEHDKEVKSQIFFGSSNPCLVIEEGYRCLN